MVRKSGCWVYSVKTRTAPAPSTAEQCAGTESGKNISAISVYNITRPRLILGKLQFVGQSVSCRLPVGSKKFGEGEFRRSGADWETP